MDIVKQLVAERPDMWGCVMAEQDNAVRINDFIYMAPAVSNAYMVVTGAGRVIINTGMGFEGPVIKKAFDKICPGPTPYILLTQAHVDHVGGVVQFREPETKLVGQRNLAACQADDKRIKNVRESQAYIWFSHVFDKMAELAQKTLPGARPITQDVPVADITFDDRYDFELGGVRFELSSVPGGETIDSVAVWLPQHKILFSGNMFGPLFPHFPNFNTIRGDRYRQFEFYLESLRRVRALEPEMLITGHFDPIVGKNLIRTCLDRLHDAVSYVHSETLKGMNAGKDIFTLMREVQLPDELYVGQGYGKVSWGVRTVWELYMGWFKGRKTSDLYPTQPEAVYPELVQLIGIDAVVALGRNKLQAGDAEAANLIAEIALANNANHRGALQLSLDAHTALLERSGSTNFWETGWLRTRIQALQRQLPK